MQADRPSHGRCVSTADRLPSISTVSRRTRTTRPRWHAACPTLALVRVQARQHERDGDHDDREQRADREPDEPGRARHRLQPDGEEHGERDDVADAVEHDAAECPAARHRRVTAQPAGAEELADANGQHVVAREAAEQHPVERAKPEGRACPRSAASGRPGTRSRRPSTSTASSDGAEARPPRARRRTASRSALRNASQRKNALEADADEARRAPCRDSRSCRERSTLLTHARRVLRVDRRASPAQTSSSSPSYASSNSSGVGSSRGRCVTRSRFAPDASKASTASSRER